MTTLQRSSYSFRRQGSSGRIWEKVVYGPELNAGGGSQLPLTHTRERAQQERYNCKDIVSHANARVAAAAAAEEETNASPPVAPLPPSRSHTKAITCGFITLFGRCGKHNYITEYALILVTRKEGSLEKRRNEQMNNRCSGKSSALFPCIKVLRPKSKTKFFTLSWNVSKPFLAM
nr:hypothetical protein CDL12_22018 [Ipomoea batatas]